MSKVKADLNELFAEFDLERTLTNQSLTQWLEISGWQVDEFSEQVLGKIEPRLTFEIEGWFEEELKMQLLSIIFFLSEIKEPNKIGLFFERPISAEIEDKKISVVTDCMISSIRGISAPQTPYFFMQEFKKSKGDNQDPEGQMLAAMLAAQHLNNNGNVLYGSYVVGAFWYFTTLEGKNYARSEAFQLTKPKELRQVILTLRKLKQIILNDLMD